MRVLIAMDKFKGSLTATEAGAAVQRGLARVEPSWETDLCPIADGGEGTTDALVTALGGEWLEAQVHDAQSRPVSARYGLCRGEDGVLEASMEMSAASGLALVSDLPLNPRTATTFGTGELMRDAVRHGAQRLVIGIGGSATNDGGAGMAQALGFVFRDAEGTPVTRIPETLERAISIDGPGHPLPEVLVACDVQNPLLGEHGATRVYGAQKGVTDFAFFEARLQHLADLVARDLRVNPADVAGAGAAGGLGFGLMAFCGARLTSGFELVARLTKLERRVLEADLIITGEGRIDSQTLHGKGPAGVADLARQAGKPVIGIAGMVEDSPGVRERFELVAGIKPAGMPVTEAMQRGTELIEETVVRLAPLIRECASRA